VTFVNKPTAGASAGFVIAMSVALWYKERSWHKILKT
jgi:biotin transporter BioY